MLNFIVLMGRLTADTELKQTQNFKSFVRFNIAVNRYTKDKDHPEADFFKIVAWEKNAEFICKYFSKGDPIIIEGSVRTGSFTDDEGIKRKTFEVWARGVNFACSKKDKPGENYETNLIEKEVNNCLAAKNKSKTEAVQEKFYGDEELPF
ncbi:MAG: single-stranded DNA-binding protein [Oscillospiraceae bacterium]|jgi:single-strand DNA-binding protein|nr:single-stranded DNA-binding protein [Oscillospiraceae bacterium]